MRHLAVLAACGLGGCGDNSLAAGDVLAPGADLAIVAHQDDDLLFMQPDLDEAIRRGQGVTTVYVTAGNGTSGTKYSDRRYDGLMAAYGAAAGSDDWVCGYIELVGHAAEHCRLEDQRVSLVFLGYPDGGKEGQLDASLLQLWEGTITSAETIAHRQTRYDREGLIETVGEIVRETEPRVIHTLDIPDTHGRDHSDHMIVGALTLLAMAHANSQADLLSYRGYNNVDDPPNKNQAVFNASFDVLTYYEACATKCAACGDPCPMIEDAHVEWLLRRYATGFRRAAAGRLRSETRCLTSTLALAPCETAPAWRIDRGGELQAADGGCLEVTDTGELAMSPCIGGRGHRFFVDDEGHIWSGMPPSPEAGMDYAHLWCLAPTETGVRVQVCGADRAPRWEIEPHTVDTLRSDISITATGREVRLADITGDGKADLCAIDGGALTCATGDGMGSFLPAVRLDNPAAPLAIDPRSLTLGDVDGDHRLDACGRDVDGILCALAANDFATERWSQAFGDAAARPTTSASLTALDADGDGVAEICGIDIDGVVCAPHGLTLQAIVRSQWPSPDSVVWPADLDGDGQADWCAATDTGPACAAFAEREVTTDGVPWGYSIGGVVEVAPATTATVAFGDIDGDGRADLCSLHEDRIQCARSQGRAFGPRATFAILPNQSVASALWLGDLDGDGRADACADTGTTITCAIEP